MLLRLPRNARRAATGNGQPHNHTTTQTHAYAYAYADGRRNTPSKTYREWERREYCSVTESHTHTRIRIRNRRLPPCIYVPHKYTPWRCGQVGTVSPRWVAHPEPRAQSPVPRASYQAASKGKSANGRGKLDRDTWSHTPHSTVTVATATTARLPRRQPHRARLKVNSRESHVAAYTHTPRVTHLHLTACVTVSSSFVSIVSIVQGEIKSSNIILYFRCGILSTKFCVTDRNWQNKIQIPKKMEREDGFLFSFFFLLLQLF